MPSGEPPVDGVVVVGMHRSGTSVATRLINLLGLHLCPGDDLVPLSAANPTGHWESQTLVDLNDRLLASIGRSWWCPPRSDQPAADGDPDHARALFARAHAERPWVWKDPRLAATLPFWTATLQQRVVAVVPLRHPLDVARSLYERNAFPVALGVALWERYMRLALRSLRGMAVHVDHYDALVDDPVAWLARVGAFLQAHGIVSAPDAGVEFVQPALRHHRSVTELEGTFPATAAVYRAVVSLTGVHDPFEPPPLPPESPWVEAEITAYASTRTAPLPRPLEPQVSVVADPGWAQPLPPFCQRVDRDRMGEASGATLVFARPRTRIPGEWWAAMRGALAGGFDAVGPGVRLAGGAAGYGLVWRDHWLNQTWLPRPPGAGPQAALFLPEACFAVTRRAFDAVGGFDPGLGAGGTDVTELCLRLWRAGYRCAVTPDVVVDDDGPRELPADDDGWAAYLEAVLRMASIHLDVDDLSCVVEGVRRRPPVPGAAVRLLQGDVAERRRRYLSEEWAPTAAVLERFGVSIDPMREERRLLAGGGEPRMVFVGGPHFSGADIVARLLASDPLASGFSHSAAMYNEGQHLQDVYPPANRFGGPGRFALDPGAHLTETSELVSAEAARRLFGQWSSRWDLSRPVLIEQSPPNIVRTRFLQAMFAGASFVMVKRHPLATALETTTDPDAVLTALDNWFAAWRTFEADRGALARCLVVVVEDVDAAPERVVEGLQEFTGLRHLEASGVADPARPARTLARWDEWCGATPASYLDHLVRRFGAETAAHGYDLLRPADGPVQPAASMARVAVPAMS